MRRRAFDFERDLRARYGEATLRTALGLPGRMVEFDCHVAGSWPGAGATTVFELRESPGSRTAVWRSSDPQALKTHGRYRIRGRVKALEQVPHEVGFRAVLTHCVVLHAYEEGTDA